jgi:Ca2+-binding RTX toxin-like protein
MGDLNAYRLEDPLTTLTNAGYTSLFDSASYSYQFNGQWGSLDHALASASLNSQVAGAAKWHINADEPTVLDYNTEFKSTGQVTSFYNVDPFRTSDHDPIIVGLNLTPTNETPTLAIASTNATQTEGNSGTKAFTFTVIRSGSTSSASSANWAVKGSGTNPANATDFGGTLPSGIVSFAVSETTQTVTVNVSGDATLELDEGFTVTLSNPTNATITTTSATGTITNDDFPPTITVSNPSIAEGNSGTKNLVFNISLSAASSQPVTLNYATADGTATANNDYTPTNGSLSFYGGNTLLTVNVPIIGDSTDEPDETLFLNLSNASGATIATSQGVGTIVNDDGGAISWTGTGGNDIFTAGDGDDSLSGLAGKDTLDGKAGNDSLTGGLGADILTGGGGADSFIYSNWSDSLFGTQDRIRDFNPEQGDRLNVGPIPNKVYNAGVITASNLTNAINSVFADANPTTSGNQALGINEAVFFSYGGKLKSNYLVVNDSTGTFNAGTDLFINVTGLVGNMVTGELTPSNYFI